MEKIDFSKFDVKMRDLVKFLIIQKDLCTKKHQQEINAIADQKCIICHRRIHNVRNLRDNTSNVPKQLSECTGKYGAFIYAICDKCLSLPNCELKAKLKADEAAQKVLLQVKELTSKYYCPKCSKKSYWIEYEMVNNPEKKLTIGCCLACKILWEVNSKNLRDNDNDNQFSYGSYEKFWDEIEKIDPENFYNFELVEHYKKDYFSALSKNNPYSKN